MRRIVQHWFWALLSFAVVAAVAVALLYRSATYSLHELTLTPLDNNTWAAGQTQLEYERLRATVRRAMHADPIVDRDALQLRIDILHSRLGVLAAGDVERALKRLPGFAPQLLQLSTLMATMDQIVAADPAAPLVDISARMDELLGGTDDMVRRLTGDVVQISAVIRQKHEEELSRLLTQLQIVFLLFAAGILAGGAVVVRQTRQLMKSERSARKVMRELTQANAAKSRFLANMSHELRTPLNAVIGFSDVLCQQMFGPLPSRYAGYARDINHSANHLLSLIEDVLDVARIEAGHTDLKAQRMAFTEVAHAALLVIHPQATRGDVDLTIRPGPRRDLDGDPCGIRQILVNLLGNAVKFTPAGGRVEFGWRIADSGDLIIEIVDTGIGIPVADLPRVTQPLHRGANAAAIGGSGLGLAITRTLIELHGGKLEITSSVGKGTRARVILPAASLHVPADPALSELSGPSRAA